MRSSAGSSRPKTFAVTLAALAVGLMSAGCTGDGPPTGATTPSATPGGSAGSSMTFEEAYRKLPLDGTKDLPITWDLSGMPDTDAILAARRSLVFNYWEMGSTDWTTIIPIGRFTYTERYYQEFLAPFATSTSDNPSVGPIWVKVMGIEQMGQDQSRVTFCTDLGYWHEARQKNPGARKGRANLESYVMENVQTGDGERHWLADRLIDKDVDREAKYGTECTKWAQHQP
jgi:hypothetical protein